MNHFPFALRNALLLPFTPETDRRKHIKITGAALGYPGARVILQDLFVEASFSSENIDRGATGLLVNNFPQTDTGNKANGGVAQLLMRVGWKGKGYLTEELLPYGLFLNKAKPLTPTWNFARPYRMDPGEALTAKLWPANIHITNNTNCGSESNSIQFGKCVGLMFHGVRIKDGNPIMLYDASQELACTASTDYTITPTGMTQQTLGCPADSSILIHSVSLSNFDLSNYDNDSVLGGLGGCLAQIYSPSGREWMTSIMAEDFPFGVTVWVGISNQDTTTCRHWVNPVGATVELGEERGWLKEASEQITVELEWASGALDQLGAAGLVYTPPAEKGGVAVYAWPMLVTVRGVLEVPDA